MPWLLLYFPTYLLVLSVVLFLLGELTVTDKNSHSTITFSATSLLLSLSLMPGRLTLRCRGDYLA